MGGCGYCAEDIAGDTALILAALKGHTEIARELLQKGADAKAANNNGEWRGARRAAGAQDGGMFRVTGARVFRGAAS